jgi:hypothetical protein
VLVYLWKLIHIGGHLLVPLDQQIVLGCLPAVVLQEQHKHHAIIPNMMLQSNAYPTVDWLRAELDRSSNCCLRVLTSSFRAVTRPSMDLVFCNQSRVRVSSRPRAIFRNTLVTCLCSFTRATNFACASFGSIMMMSYSSLRES